MIIGMFIYAAISIIMGIYSIYKKKGILAFFFLFMGIAFAVIGGLAVYMYPHIWPF